MILSLRKLRSLLVYEGDQTSWPRVIVDLHLSMVYTHGRHFRTPSRTHGGLERVDDLICTRACPSSSSKLSNRSHILNGISTTVMAGWSFAVRSGSSNRSSPISLSNCNQHEYILWYQSIPTKSWQIVLLNCQVDRSIASPLGYDLATIVNMRTQALSV